MLVVATFTTHHFSSKKFSSFRCSASPKKSKDFSGYLFRRFCDAKPSIMHFEKMQFMTRRVNSCDEVAIHGAALLREFMCEAPIRNSWSSFAARIHAHSANCNSCAKHQKSPLFRLRIVLEFLQKRILQFFECFAVLAADGFAV